MAMDEQEQPRRDVVPDASNSLTAKATYRKPLRQSPKERAHEPQPDYHHEQQHTADAAANRQTHPIIGSSSSSIDVVHLQSLHHGATRSISLSPPVIYVSHGCLLLPVAFMLWFYWTKRFARSVIRGLLTRTATPPASAQENHDQFDEYDLPHNNSFDMPSPLGCGEDFSCWDDVMEHNLQDTSLRYVRWYKATVNNDATSQSNSWTTLSVTDFLSRRIGRRRRPASGSPYHATESSTTSWLSSLLSREDVEYEPFEAFNTGAVDVPSNEIL